MNITRNTNDFNKGPDEWYVKIPGKQAWEYFKTRFEAALRKLQNIRGNPCKAHITTKQTFSKQIQPIKS